MAAIELATGYVTLAVETSNIAKQVGKAFNGAEGMAKNTGLKMGKAMKSAVESQSPDMGTLKRAVDDAADKVEAAQNRMKTAAEKSARAQEASAQRVESAQRAVDKAFRDQELAAEKLRGAQNQLARMQEQGTGTAKQLEDAQLRVKRAENDVANAGDRVAAAQDKAKAAVQRHGDASKAADAQMELLNDELTRTKKELEQAEGAFSQAQSEMRDTEGIAQKTGGGIRGAFQKAFGGVKGEASDAADGVETEFRGVGEEGANSVTTSFDKAFKALPGLFAAVGLGAVISESISSGIEQSAIPNKIQASLGLDPEMAQKAGSAAGKLYTSGYGDSLDEVSSAVETAIGSIQHLRGAGEESIERVTGYALNLSEAFGVDVADSVGAIGVMINNGLVPDADAGFDLLTGAMQQVPQAFRGEMTDAIIEYSKHFAGMGIDGQTAIGMLTQASKNGSIGIDKMGDAVKEFQIRSTDMSKSTTDAYGMIGLNAEEMTGKLLAGGDSAEEAFGQIIHGLQGMDDPTEQSQAALALFGTQLEDLGVDQIPEFLGMLDPAGDAFDDFGGKADEVGNLLQDTEKNKVESFKRSFSQGFVSAFAKALDVMEPFVSFLKDTSDIWGPFAAVLGIVATAAAIYAGASAFASAMSTAYAVATGAAAGATTLLSGALVVLLSPITWVVAAIGLLISAFILAYNKVGWFRDMVDAAWAWIKDVTAAFVAWWTETAWPAIVNVLQWIGDKFVWLYESVIKPVWGWITGVISGFLAWWNESFVPGVQTAIDAVGAVFRWLYDAIIQPVWNAIMVVITMVVAVVMTVVQAWVGFFQNVIAPVFRWFYESVIKPVWDWISEKIGAFVVWFRDVAIPAIQVALGWARDAFQWLSDKVTAVWDWISSKISSNWAWVRDTILTPLISFLKVYVGGAFQWLGQKVSDVWHWIATRISDAWSWVRDVVLNPLISFLKVYVGGAFQWIGQKVSDVWHWIATRISDAWNWTKNIVLNPLISFLKDTLGGAWNWLRDHTGAIWDAMSGKIRDSWAWIKDKVLNPMGDFLKNNVVEFFRKTKEGVGEIWDGLKETVKAPVKFVLETVIRDGIVKNYNDLNDFWSGDDIKFKMPAGFARGGILPGYQSRKKDELLTPMRKGEGVLVPEATRALGSDFIYGINDAANVGGISAAKKWAQKRGIAAGDPGAAANWVGGESFTMGAPPSGASGIWGSFQAAASRAGAMNFPDKMFMGASTKRAAQAWMGRSALNVNTDGHGPSVSVSSGTAGPWGFNQGSAVTVNPSAPRNMVLSILMHEFGHALSLHHTSNPGSLMHPAIAGVKQPSAMDYAALVSAWGKPGEGVKTYDVNGGESGILSWLMEKLSSPVRALLDKAQEKFSGNKFMQMPFGIGEKMLDNIISWVTEKFGGAFDGGGDGGVQRWAGTVKDALSRVGLPTRDEYVNAWLKQIQTESGGNPRAVQGAIGDINNATGNLAQGLVQVTPPTFADYRDKSLPNDPFNPLASLVAGMNYAKSRYGTSGMLGVIGQGHGYARGGIVGGIKLYDKGGLIERGVQLIDHQRSTPDYVLTDKQWDAMYRIAENSAAGGNEIHVHTQAPVEDPSIYGRRVGEAMAFQLQKAGFR